jgi:very-short-patch-repair endonuclease
VKHDPNSVRRARESRKNQTSAEARLWSLLRNRRLIKRKFRRQHPIGIYVVDFACPAVHLVIEVDGPSHEDAEQQAFDQQRTEYLESEGWRVMRIKNQDVYSALWHVEHQVVSAIGD